MKQFQKEAKPTSPDETTVTYQDIFGCHKTSGSSKEYFDDFKSELILFYFFLNNITLITGPNEKKVQQDIRCTGKVRGYLPDPVHPGPVQERVLNQQVIFPSCLDQVSGAISLELLITFAEKLLNRLYCAVREGKPSLR